MCVHLHFFPSSLPILLSIDTCARKRGAKLGKKANAEAGLSLSNHLYEGVCEE